MDADSRATGHSVPRVVALGASNLTRGMYALVSAVRDMWGRDFEIFVALGNGRSFGAPSRVFVRTLPGILQSGLWARLESLPPAPAIGLIADVGNDILYGTGVLQILEWVEECARRLRCCARDVVIADLPLETVRHLTPRRFLLFRTLWFPGCRLSLEYVLAEAEQLSAGLEGIATRHGLRLARMKDEWYGFDPIHIRFAQMHPAWHEILSGRTGGSGAGTSSLFEAVRLYLMPPERQSLLGWEQFTPQKGTVLRSGGRVWLY